MKRRSQVVDPARIKPNDGYFAKIAALYKDKATVMVL
jgi:hypothetical protein